MIDSIDSSLICSAVFAMLLSWAAARMAGRDKKEPKLEKKLVETASQEESSWTSEKIETLKKLAAGCSSVEELKLKLGVAGIAVPGWWAFWVAQARASGKLLAAEKILALPFSVRAKIFLYGTCSVGSIAVLVHYTVELSCVWLWTIASGFAIWLLVAGLSASLLAFLAWLERQPETAAALAAVLAMPRPGVNSTAP